MLNYCFKAPLSRALKVCDTHTAQTPSTDFSPESWTFMTWSQACCNFYEMTCELRLDLHFACYLQQLPGSLGKKIWGQERREEEESRKGGKKSRGKKRWWKRRGEVDTVNKRPERGRRDRNVYSSVWESLTLASHTQTTHTVYTASQALTVFAYWHQSGRPPQESQIMWNHVCVLQE